MKKINFFNSLIIVIVAAFMGACSTDDDVEIKTLSKYGDNFYFGEKVVVWAGTDTKDIANVTYKWECDGGTLSGPQYLYENLWIAPNVPGIYTVRVTAKVGSKTSTRETKMKVSYYFFDIFDSELNYAGWVATDAKMNFDVANKKMICVGTTPTTYANIKRQFTETLNFPFSIFNNFGFQNFRGNTSYVQYRLFFKLPKDLSSYYLREIRWQFVPKASGTIKNLKIQFETYQPNTGLNKYYDIVADTISPLGKMTDKSYEDFSMSIDADTVFYAYRQNQLVSKSFAIRDWLREHPNEHPIASQMSWSFPGTTTTTATGVEFKNFYIVDNGTILTSKPE